MTTVSVTRLRLRNRRYLPFFRIQAERCLAELRRAQGYLMCALRYDLDLAYWTATVWRDEAALLACTADGAHRLAMPRMLDWSDQAAAVRWTQDGTDVPD